jgi:hypothetical protein
MRRAHRTMQTDRWCCVNGAFTLDRMEPVHAAIHVGIILALSGSITDGQIRALETEAAAVWRPYGVDVAWFNANADCNADDRMSGTPVDRMLRLVADAGETSNGALGAVRFEKGIPDDTIHLLYAPLTRIVLESSIGSWSIGLLAPSLRDRMVGQAFGRVVAHELGHILLGLPSHDKSGLMRSRFDSVDLVGWDSDRLKLSKPDAHRLAERLRVLASP